jgi:O-acetyl-ADP-ribose deacetylase (regulator of RNase III)
MIRFTQGNLLESGAEALVNTVNTVGVMGKGIALMFKEAFPENFVAYEEACKDGAVTVGQMFVTERRQLVGPRWIINFPTKRHWRQPSRMEWIESGLEDLKRVVAQKNIRSLALPPLGSGNGGLDWIDVRAKIRSALEPLSDVDVLIYEPTTKYQNVAKPSGVEALTPARALIAELIRRYWILGIECTLLEVQKLAYFLERHVEALRLPNSLDLRLEANKFGPFAPRLTHFLDRLDGSYLHCEKRLADAGPLDTIWFEDSKRDFVSAYLSSTDAKPYQPALDATTKLIEGFESPLGMELLATVDWLILRENLDPNVPAIRQGLARWPAGGMKAAERKQRLFGDRLIELALQRLSASAELRSAN